MNLDSFLINKGYMKPVEQVFTDIYTNRKWDEPNATNESVSGNGSSLDFTRNVREKLPQLLDTFSITTLFDAPCGDLNWMSKVLEVTPNIKYIGGDIVGPLIEANKVKYSNRPNLSFINIDIINDSLPDADLMLCRDCLFHFSEQDIKTFLRNFVNSNILALLTTTDIGPGANRDITTGNYRHLNLMIEPYNFTQDFIYEIDDWPYPTPPTRKLYMWSREQIENIIKGY
jgi:hypothetical protein